jgi:hypothetical protein
LLQCEDGIKGVNWLTAVSDGLLNRVGGETAAREALAGCDVQFFGYSGGQVIQAGIAPELGDADLGLIPPSYQKVARFLKPIRAQYNASLLDTPPGVDRRAFAQQWLGRLD